MSVKRYKLALPESTMRIRRARKRLEAMTKDERIDLMVKAGVMTPEQAARAKETIAQKGD